jgi:hypothetical protein
VCCYSASVTSSGSRLCLWIRLPSQGAAPPCGSVGDDPINRLAGRRDSVAERGGIVIDRAPMLRD